MFEGVMESEVRRLSDPGQRTRQEIGKDSLSAITGH